MNRIRTDERIGELIKKASHSCRSNVDKLVIVGKGQASVRIPQTGLVLKSKGWISHC